MVCSLRLLSVAKVMEEAWSVITELGRKCVTRRIRLRRHGLSMEFAAPHTNAADIETVPPPLGGAPGRALDCVPWSAALTWAVSGAHSAVKRAPPCLAPALPRSRQLMNLQYAWMLHVAHPKSGCRQRSLIIMSLQKAVSVVLIGCVCHFCTLPFLCRRCCSYRSPCLPALFTLSL